MKKASQETDKFFTSVLAIILPLMHWATFPLIVLFSSLKSNIVKKLFSKSKL